MTTGTIPWSAGRWTAPPASIREEGDALVVRAAAESDYWRHTLYGFVHDDGHGLLAPFTPEHAVEVSFRADTLTSLYDQAGLLLWVDDEHWIKTGVEITDGVPHLGAVVTDVFSDWSLAPVPEWAGQLVTLRASRVADAVVLRARAGDEAWRTLRVCRFDYEDASAGPLVCAPLSGDLEVTFTRWANVAPDTDLHEDPPLPEHASL